MHLQKQLSENVFIDERRPVLLCDGKLCLRALQDLFNLTIVEMLYGKSVKRMFDFFFSAFLNVKLCITSRLKGFQFVAIPERADQSCLPFTLHCPLD